MYVPFEYPINVSAVLLIEISFNSQDCIENLKRRFTNSARVQRLVGMRYEAEGKLNEAQKVYDTILQEDESNVVSSLCAGSTEHRLRCTHVHPV
jgi:hypothetical protein